MFQQNAPRTKLAATINIAELIFHTVVRNVRKSHNNAFMAILMNMLQTVIMVLAFYVMFSVLGLRRSAIRGDFLVYLMSGIFLYMTHSKTLGAVASSEGPSNPMMQHAPMNTIISIVSAAVGMLYIQTLSALAILFIYNAIFGTVTFDDPVGTYAMFLLAWFVGFAIGLVLLAIKPWFPTFVKIFTTVYQRANMIASGKMFLANSLPGYLLAMFDWNPLFHAIDQARGYAFINYNPHHSSWQYAFWVGITLIMLGLMGEFFTRKHASLSWNARR